MFKNICLPTDGSPISQAGVEKGLAFARDCGASAMIVTVFETPALFTSDTPPAETLREAYDRTAREVAEKRIHPMELRAKELGVLCSSVVLSNHRVFEGILEVADKHGCDLIAMASHGRYGYSALLGSETQRVLVHSGIPVLVFK